MGAGGCAWVGTGCVGAAAALAGAGAACARAGGGAGARLIHSGSVFWTCILQISLLEFKHLEPQLHLPVLLSC